MSLLLSFGLFLSVSQAKDFPSPPESYVYDEPKILSNNTKNRLFTLLKSQEDQTTNQIIVAVFNSLDGEDLVDWTNQLFKAWKIGQKGKDNGILLTLYWKDRKARIEVGYGLESILTDARSKRILEQNLIPYLKRNQPNEAVMSAASAIIQTILDPNAKSIKHGRESGLPLWLVVLFAVSPFVLFLFIIISTYKDTHISRTGTSRRRSNWFDHWTGTSGSGGWSSGGHWGGGLGGGGYGGGGGRSGGGGASGGW